MSTGILPRIAGSPGVVVVPERRIPALDGWRGIAILLVLFCHTAIALRTVVYIPHDESIGQHGVVIFFVLSGYLITSLLLQEQQRNGAVDLRGFYIRRFFRLMPCAWTYLAGVVVFTLSQHPKPFTAADMLGCIFFFRNFVDQAGLHARVTGHFWSLSIEEQFYLVWPAVLVFFRPKGARWIALGGAIAIAAHRFDNWNQLALMPLQATFETQYRADALLIGCAAALWLPALLPYARKWMALPLLSILIACLAIYEQMIPLWESVIIALLLIVTSTQTESRLTAFLEWKPLRKVGQFSYSIYVWQQLLFFLLPGHLVLGLWLLPVSMLCSYYFIEQPARRYGVKLAARLASGLESEQEHSAAKLLHQPHASSST